MLEKQTKMDRRCVILSGLALAAASQAAVADSGLEELSPSILEAAKQSLALHAGKVTKPEFIGIIDFAIPSYRPRFYVVSSDLKTVIAKYYTSHGRGSDPGDLSPVPVSFSNDSGSKATCLSGFLGLEEYVGKHGRSLRLEGLDPTNSNARSRSIVIHTAPYVDPARAKDKIPMGRSEGCFVVSKGDLSAVVSAFQGGGFIYAGMTGYKP